MGGYFSDVVDILAGFGFDVLGAVGVAEFQNFPEHCVGKWPRPHFTDSEGREWPIYVHEIDRTLEVRINESLGKAMIVSKGVAETRDVDLIEGFLALQARLAQITKTL